MINTNRQNLTKKLMIVFAHAFVGWALCATTMGIGMATLPLATALIVHAIGAPLFFAVVSLVYFSRFSYTTPLQTALLFVGFVMAVDFFVVALLINRYLGDVQIPATLRQPQGDAHDQPITLAPLLTHCALRTRHLSSPNPV